MRNSVLLSCIKGTCEKRILGYYPLYKQFNIQSLQGYTVDDRNKMWLFINACRAKCKEFELLYEQGELTSLSQIDYSSIIP